MYSYILAIVACLVKEVLKNKTYIYSFQGKGKTFLEYNFGTFWNLFDSYFIRIFKFVKINIVILISNLPEVVCVHDLCLPLGKTICFQNMIIFHFSLFRAIFRFPEFHNSSTATEFLKLHPQLYNIGTFCKIDVYYNFCCGKRCNMFQNWYRWRHWYYYTGILVSLFQSLFSGFVIFMLKIFDNWPFLLHYSWSLKI